MPAASGNHSVRRVKERIGRHQNAAAGRTAETTMELRQGGRAWDTDLKGAVTICVDEALTGLAEPLPRQHYA
jgi:hypothetical protein